jgi:predicted nucleic acid-binding protein
VILVDTSVWVDHFQQSEGRLVQALEDGNVLVHPFVIGELACGNLKDRSVVLGLLRALPGATVATDVEVLAFIDRHQLMGRGIGYVDTHLLAATALSAPATIWTKDRRLRDVAAELGLTPPT